MFLAQERQHTCRRIQFGRLREKGITSDSAIKTPNLLNSESAKITKRPQSLASQQDASLRRAESQLGVSGRCCDTGSPHGRFAGPQ